MTVDAHNTSAPYLDDSHFSHRTGGSVNSRNFCLEVESKSLMQKEQTLGGGPTTWLPGVAAFKLFVFSQP